MNLWKPRLHSFLEKQIKAVQWSVFVIDLIREYAKHDLIFHLHLGIVIWLIAFIPKLANLDFIFNLRYFFYSGIVKVIYMIKISVEYAAVFIYWHLIFRRFVFNCILTVLHKSTWAGLCIWSIKLLFVDCFQKVNWLIHLSSKYNFILFTILTCTYTCHWDGATQVLAVNWTVSRR